MDRSKRGGEPSLLAHFFRLYSIGPQKPCPRMVSVCLTYVRFTDSLRPWTQVVATAKSRSQRLSVRGELSALLKDGV
jgi:hypothetical protein